MAENLKASKYNDGTSIPNIKDSTLWKNNTSTGAYVYYKNDAANNAKYGKLYNWYAVSPTTNGYKNVCPTGWHVPTDAEWTILIDYLGGDSIAGGKMREVGTKSWNSPNTDATNTSLFSAIPGGGRDWSGNYMYSGDIVFYWSSTEYDTGTAWAQIQQHTEQALYLSFKDNENKKIGGSIRCLRD
jgi:uncharacterized protein (TIGR02145 family)